MQTQIELKRFTEGFRNEHRAARDIFLGIAEALRNRDAARIGELMGQADAGIGPHMRYEEEEMYPALASLYGDDYVERMLGDHDRAFGVAGRLMELASHQPITDEDIQEGNRLIQHMLPHVTDCDGLVLAIEVPPEDRQRTIFAARDRALAEGLTMMRWGRAARASSGRARLGRAVTDRLSVAPGEAVSVMFPAALVGGLRDIERTDRWTMINRCDPSAER